MGANGRVGCGVGKEVGSGVGPGVSIKDTRGAGLTVGAKVASVVGLVGASVGGSLSDTGDRVESFSLTTDSASIVGNTVDVWGAAVCRETGAGVLGGEIGG